jgi:hypothetical protein
VKKKPKRKFNPNAVGNSGKRAGRPESERSRQLRKLLEEANVYHKLCEAALSGRMTRQEEIASQKMIDKWRQSVTKRQEEIVWETLAKYYPDLYENVIGEPSEKISKWRRDYEKAYYERPPRGQHPETWRKAVDLVRRCLNAKILNQESGHAETDAERMAVLKPLHDALTNLDCEFLDCLAKAARMLDTRLRSCKGATIGSGDLHLGKGLLEYSLTVPETGKHTVRELNEQFVSKFRSISNAKLRERCRNLGVALKEDVRGAGSVRRKAKASNSTTTPQKKD